MEIYWTKIKEIIEETPEIRTYHLECPVGVTWEEGAHIHLALEGFNAGDKPNRALVRHMSISTVQKETTIGITTRLKEERSEFKTILGNLAIGDQVAVFKIKSNLALRRENRNVYLLSSGVGLASFRPLVLQYLADNKEINKIHSLHISDKKDRLFESVFNGQSTPALTSEVVNQRSDYYDSVQSLAVDKEGLFYLVGSDEFLTQNISLLLEAGIPAGQIVIDKHENKRALFLSEAAV